MKLSVARRVKLPTEKIPGGRGVEDQSVLRAFGFTSTLILLPQRIYNGINAHSPALVQCFRGKYVEISCFLYEFIFSFVLGLVLSVVYKMGKYYLDL